VSHQHQDKTFFSTFTGVLGVLILLAIAFYSVARLIGTWADTIREERDSMTATEIAAVKIEARIQPIGQVYIEGVNPPPAARAADTPEAVTPPSQAEAGEEDTALKDTPLKGSEAGIAQSTASGTASAATRGDPVHGKVIYESACVACHATGVVGAPKIGNKADWAPRIEAGTGMLLQHALNGFGKMPPKGGRLDLSDGDVADAVAFMVSESK
jgi:Cytochrome c5